MNYFIVVFFNVALVAAAADRLAGGNATINYGLQVAWQRKGKIFQWALLASTVGIILNALERRLGWLGRLATRFIGVAWTMATFFVVPLLAAEDVGPAEALVRSGELFTETWGEQLVGGFSFGLIFVLLAIPGAALPFLLGSAFGSTGVVTGAILMIVYWLLLSVISAAVQGIFMRRPIRLRHHQASPADLPPHRLLHRLATQTIAALFLGTPISRLAPSPFSPLPSSGHDISCPANMLGYMCAIRLAQTGPR